jgi:hypothetical protein
MRLDRLTPQQVQDHWPKLVGYCLQMERRFPDDWPVAEFVRQVEAGELVPWLAYDEETNKHYALVGTTLKLKASGRLFLTVPFAAGTEHHLWTPTGMPVLEEFARQRNAVAVDVYGRAGWGRQLGPLGFRALAMAQFRKELEQ